MLGNLISAIMLTTAIGIGGPLNTSTDYQDVNVTETYEYETNEVNSVDDLIVGNIYKLNGNVYDGHGQYYLDCAYDISLVMYNLEFNNNVTDSVVGEVDEVMVDDYSLYNTNLYYYDKNSFSHYDYYIINDTSAYIYDIYIYNLPNYWLKSAYIVYNSTLANIFNNLVDSYVFFSVSDYLGEKTVTVTPIEYDGMFAIFTNFLYSRLFSGDVLTSMETTILGQTLTLGQWVSSSVAIVLLCLIVFMLVKFVIFLFKIVGGAFLWK